MRCAEEKGVLVSQLCAAMTGADCVLERVKEFKECKAFTVALIFDCKNAAETSMKQ